MTAPSSNNTVPVDPNNPFANNGANDFLGNQPTSPGTTDGAAALASIATQWVSDLAAAIIKPALDWMGAGICNTLNQVLNTTFYVVLEGLGILGMVAGVMILASEHGGTPGVGSVVSKVVSLGKFL